MHCKTQKQLFLQNSPTEMDKPKIPSCHIYKKNFGCSGAFGSSPAQTRALNLGCGAILLYHLADNPEKQERLYEEICSVIGPSGKMTTSSLAKMRYLKACQTESQRMLPAVFGSSRRLTVSLSSSETHEYVFP